MGIVIPQGGAGLGDKVVMTLTSFGKLNGKVLLEKTKMHPPVWVGTLTAKMEQSGNSRPSWRRRRRGHIHFF